jgi:hypothetical protein
MATHAKTTWKRKTGEGRASAILVLVSLASLMFIMMPLLFLFCLMQPTMRANPGLKAYDPSSGTRMQPIAHSVQSKDYPREFSSATNFARDYVRPELAEGAEVQEIQVATKHQRRLAGRKNRVAHRSKHEQAAQAYAQERNDYWQPRYQ